MCWSMLQHPDYVCSCFHPFLSPPLPPCHPPQVLGKPCSTCLWTLPKETQRSSTVAYRLGLRVGVRVLSFLLLKDTGTTKEVTESSIQALGKPKRSVLPPSTSSIIVQVMQYEYVILSASESPRLRIGNSVDNGSSTLMQSLDCRWIGRGRRSMADTFGAKESNLRYPIITSTSTILNSADIILLHYKS